MSANHDGGPAFPRPASENTAGGTCPDGNYVEHARDGMSLRDYFAIHATQPGASEIITAAGFTEPRPGFVAFTSTDERTFDSWWRGLSNERRFALSAQVRFAQADAMLACRSKA